MIVVPHVAQVTAQRPVDDFTVAPVRRDGLRVDEDRLIPPAAAHIDVRGHVHQMSETRREIPQPIGRRIGPARLRRRLVGVDREVVGQRMPRI